MEPAARKKRRSRRYSASLAKGVLVLSHDAALPAVCMKCGTHDEIVRREVVFTWSPVWVRYLVFCAVGVLLRYFVRERASLVIPLCPRCNGRWSAARYASIASIVAFFAAALIAPRILGPTNLARALIGTALVLLALVHYAFVRPRVLGVHHINEEAISFERTNPEAAKEILEGARS